jgi:hypothetical protein
VIRAAAGDKRDISGAVVLLAFQLEKNAAEAADAMISYRW